MHLDQLLHAEPIVLDLLDVPDSLVKRTHRTLIVASANLGTPTTQIGAPFEIGARHSVLDELDARKISCEVLHRGAPAAQQTDENDTGENAAEVHCSMNLPLLKS
jgi:hypothetical protein